MPTIDADSHLYETRELWREHATAADRDRCLRIVDDERGYSWLTLGDTRIEVLGVHDAGDVAQSGRFRTRLADGLPPEIPYDAMPAGFHDPVARLALLDDFRIDETILFPNCGIMWERALGNDLPATLVNMSAWNRRAIEIVAEGHGRLHPVAHVTLRDRDWLDRELATLAAGGVRLAMVAPALVDGRRLSHPDHERAWAAFAQHGIAVCFHVAQYAPVIDDAWNEGDPDWSNPAMSSVFLWTPPAVALADLIMRGVLDRHPGLRFGVVELFSAWVPLFLASLDGGFSFHEQFNGRPLAALAMRPSDYFRRQVRVASFGFERPARLAASAGDLFMFGSDWPHPEGLRRPLDDFVAACGESPESAPSLYEANARWLLGA